MRVQNAGHLPISEFQGSEHKGTKRGCVDEHQSFPKRQKKDHIFPFLDLPGELQNHIYAFAAEDTRQSWPDPQHIAPLKQVRRKSAETPSIKHNFPFLGLTQTCTKIRSEFRAWWMSGHRIPLNELGQYISVFLRNPPKKDRNRFEACFNRAGTLRVWIGSRESRNMDILSLVKLKMRFPDYNIIFEHPPDISEVAVFGLNQFINNTHPKWLRWLRGNIVTQARLQRDNVYLVIREKQATGWMKDTLKGRVPVGFLETIGLDKVVHWAITFGVCY